MSEQKKGNGKKGFEGLEDLFSGADQPKETSPQRATSDSSQPQAATPSKPKASRRESSTPPKPRQTATSSAPSTPKRTTTKPTPTNHPGQPSGNPTGKMFLWVIGIVIVLIIIAQSDNDKPGPKPQQQTVSARPAETKPPTGTNLVLSVDQIRYCLAEEQRLESMEHQINTTSGSEINKFNSYVDDYNSRCGSYRYRSGSLSSAKRSIANWSSTYAQEGRSRVASWQSPTVSSSTARSGASQRPTYASKPQPSKLVRDVQQILAALGYEPGPIDGLTGSKTAAAVMRFQSDYGFKVDGIIDQQLYSRIYELRPRDMVPKETTIQSSRPSSSSLETACAHFKSGDFRNYQRCIGGEISPSGTTRKASSGVPANASLDYTGHNWACNRGYRKSGQECVAVQIPQNASIDYTGSNWACNRGYRKSGQECVAVQIPQNASIDYTGSNWACNRGYRKSGQECLPVN